MPDWTAPFHLPTLTDEEWARQKALYVAEHGYTITIPGLSDIFTIRTVPPMTHEEHIWWKNRLWDNFSPQRLDELTKEKQKRKERYMAMLASPTPAVVQNAGSILTAIDDAQDATFTLAVAGQIARKVAPKLLGRLLKGPTGLLMTASDALNLIQDAGNYCMAPLQGKKTAERLARGSPKTYKQKLKQRLKLTSKIPVKATAIQALQTSDQVFGFGISLGPIVGLMQDIFFGSIRTKPGTFTRIKLPPPDVKHWIKAAQIMAKTLPVLWGYPYHTHDDEIAMWAATTHLTYQHLFHITQNWNPLDMFDTLENIEIRARDPWHALTLDVMQEGPPQYAHSIGWPQTNTLWANPIDIADATHPIATQNLNQFLTRNKHSWMGYFGGLCANEAAPESLACLEGESDVYTDNTEWCKAATTMIKHGYMLDPNQPHHKFELFLTFLNDCEATLWNPTMENILQFCNSPWNDIKLLRTRPTTI